MGIFGSRRRDPVRDAARGLYGAAVAQARHPDFYGAGGVPDTADGRFDLIALHVYFVLRRLRRDRPDTEALAQAVFDVMFDDMDQSLREMGAGDLGVAKRVKAMAQAFLGRVAAYDEAAASGTPALAEALRRNLYRRAEPDPGRLEALASYVREQMAALDGQALAELAGGEIRFVPPHLAGPAPAVQAAGMMR